MKFFRKDDDSREGFLQGNAHGVRRLNKLPLFIFASLIGCVLIALVYAVHKRGEQTQALQDPHEYNLVDSGQTASSLLENVPSAGVIEELEKAEKGFISPPVYMPPPADLTANSLDEERLRIRQLKVQMLETAVNATTKINLDSEVRMAHQGDSVHAAGLNLSSEPSSYSPRALSESEASDPNKQARKEAFLETQRSSNYLSSSKEMPLTAYEIKSGAIIPSVLITGINSDLPGQIIAQVSQDVFDTATGKHRLIPQGSRLIGRYDSHVARGQERVLIVWNRIIFPDASSLNLENMTGADQSGYGGFRDQVNNHYLKVFGNAFLLSMLGAGVQLSVPDSNDSEDLTPAEIIALSMAQQMGQLGMEIARKNLQIQPTLEIRPGYRFNVMVNKDIILPPYS